MTKEAPVQSDQLFRELIEHGPDAIVLLAPDGTLEYTNGALTSLTGYTGGELVGRNGLAFIHPDDLVSVKEHLARLLRKAEETQTLECRVLCKDGSWCRVEVAARNLLAQPQVEAILCSVRACTRASVLPARSSVLVNGSGPLARSGSLPRELNERQPAEYQLSDGERKFRSLVESAEYQLSDGERKFRSLVESDVIGVMVTDPIGKIYEVNAYLAHLLGYSQEELLSGEIRMKDLLLPHYHSARARAWKTLVSQGSSLPEEKEYRCKDGSTFPALVTAATINAERSRALLMLLDISDRRNADRRKEEFLSMVGHELRTPLTIIQGFLELALFCVERIAAVSSLEAGDFLNKLEAMLQHAQQQAELETRLVADLVDVSRMEMQKFEVSLQARDLLSIVRQVIVNQRQVAATREVELVLPAQDVLPVEVDADRIDQVLTNYLTNAFKYAPASQPVRVEVRVEKNMVRVSVSDHGPGLSAEQQLHVWDRFYQTENVAQQGAERGLGLGLYIVRTIIAQHQGQVGVESNSGQGATFWFMLPLSDEPIGM